MIPLSHGLLVYTALLTGLLVIFAQDKYEVCLKNSSLDTSCHEFCVMANFENIIDISTNKSIQEINIFICSRTIDLWKVITLENKKHVSVTAEQSATISCLKESAGIVFMNVDTVNISGFRLVGCSVRQNGSISFAASIVISHCNTVTMSDFEVRNSTGVGLALINICKSVEVTESLFTNCENGGLYVDYPEYQDRNCSTIICISTSNFTDNKVSNTGNKLSNGGGLKAFFQDLNHSVFMVIVECVFEKNEANWSTNIVESFSGGAVYLNINSSEVSLHINNTRFNYNSAKLHGGAVAISYHGQHYNKIVFYECNLLGNKARNGGGISLELAQDAQDFHASVSFILCEWTENMGKYGAAVDMVPSYQGDPICDNCKGAVFENCTFKENQAEESQECRDPNRITHRHHKGVLSSRDVNIWLQGRTCFESNRGSAIFLFSSNIHFNKNSHVAFIENQGYSGGAIAMYGVSVLNVYSNVSILFKRNKAHLGGAIFQDQSYGSWKKCFLQYRGNDSIQDRHVTLTFLNNTSSAENYGHSIFLSTLCYCPKDNQSIHDFLNSVATFNFSWSEKLTEVSTFGKNCNNSSQKYIVPGQVTDIDIIIDGTNDVVPPLLKISVTPSNNNSENISVDEAYVYTSNNKIKLKGKPNSTGELKVSLLHIQDYFLTMNIILQECPPGFVYSEEELACTCSVHSSHTYLGITKCNMSTFQANLTYNFWAGYIREKENDKGYGIEATFRTNNCPKGYCAPPKRHTVEVTLPNDTNRKEISRIVCHKNRRGIMCGNCVEDHSVFFHTYDYICFPDSKLCTVGWLFYILSELVPVTIFFAVVLCFNISFTSGFVSAFVFYAQMFDTLLVGANNFIFFEGPIHVLLNCLRFIVRMFNLTFFSVEQLSFCLWKGANTLDMIAFNYVTIIYSFILVIITVALANRFSIKMNQIFGVDKSHLSNSIIHGLSSFLVLCYFQSTKVSLLLLTPTFLKGDKIFSRVFYYPDWYYFKEKHFLHAIPAVFFLIFITLLPPLLLLCYPLCYKVLALFKLEESKFTKVLCKVIPLEKYKPFFDSFQGTFKDEHRYFAGLLFMYRLSALLTFAVTHSLLSFYILTELQFILMLLLHALISPHKNRRNNNLDMSIFALLAVVNGLTLLNYLKRTNVLDDGVIVSVTSSIQVLLAWIPVVCMLIYIGIKITIWIWIRVKPKQKVSSVAADIPELSLSLLDNISREPSLSSCYVIKGQKRS